MKDSMLYLKMKIQKNDKERCEIKMLSSDVGKMLELLQKQIMEYLNKKL